MNSLKTWIENQEINNGIIEGRLNGDPITCQYIYYEAKFSYINGKFLASILTIAAAVEAFLSRRIEFELFKKHLNEKKLHKLLNLNNLNDIAKKERKISNDLYSKIDKFRHVRNEVIHPKSPLFDYLGFKTTSIRGEGITSRGGEYVSPNGKPMIPLELKEGAELGISIYFQVRNELKIE